MATSDPAAAPFGRKLPSMVSSEHSLSSRLSALKCKKAKGLSDSVYSTASKRCRSLLLWLQCQTSGSLALRHEQEVVSCHAASRQLNRLVNARSRRNRRRKTRREPHVRVSDAPSVEFARDRFHAFGPFRYPENAEGRGSMRPTRPHLVPFLPTGLSCIILQTRKCSNRRHFHTGYVLTGSGQISAATFAAAAPMPLFYDPFASWLRVDNDWLDGSSCSQCRSVGRSRRLAWGDC